MNTKEVGQEAYDLLGDNVLQTGRKAVEHMQQLPQPFRPKL
ncbi:MAG: hypothetical protein OXF79_02135 [Chloroflexi bacterium]|nr:hypothetical protein [Chloroflexota bacterium]